MKRTFFLTLILNALFCYFSQCAVAASTTKIYGDEIECNSGDTVTFSVNLSDNTGITGFVIGVVCEDDWLYFVDDIKKGSFSSEGTFLGENDVRFVNAVWYNAEAVESDGELFSFDVHISPSAPDGDYPIKVMVSQENTIDGDLKEIKYEAIDGLVKVTHVELDMSQYSNQDDGLSTTTIMLIALAVVCLIAGITWIYSAKRERANKK